MVLRYINPNPTPILGEVQMVAEDGTSQAHEVVLQPTLDSQPSFVTVSGSGAGVYALPFDLTPGEYVTHVKIPNNEQDAQEVLVDYFVLIPQEYYEPRILKQNVYQPCLAGVTLPYCRHYSYPDLAAFPKTYGTSAGRPGDSFGNVYKWGENDPELTAELETPQGMGVIAKWQPQLDFPIDLNNPGKHVLAVAFFTPKVK